jgi:glycine cleavage system H protein
MNPEDLLYTKEHEWLRLSEGIGTVGITDHAQKQLGDVVYVELPKVGDTFQAGQSFGSVESVKAVSDLFMPVSGEVVEINEDVHNIPELLNAEPFNKGWLLKIRLLDPAETSSLMPAAKYTEYTAEK